MRRTKGVIMREQRQRIHRQHIKNLETRIRRYWLIFEVKVATVLLAYLLIISYIVYQWYCQAGLFSAFVLSCGFVVAFLGLIILRQSLVHRSKDSESLPYSLLGCACLLIIVAVLIYLIEA